MDARGNRAAQRRAWGAALSQSPRIAAAQLPKKLGFLLEPARYKVAYGGRGGAKSTSFAIALLVMGAQRTMRILCTREFQNSIEESVHALLKQQIEGLGLQAYYRVQKTKIFGVTGTEFIFSGLHNNVTKIKSYADIDICWVEEAEAISADSWQILKPTIRKEGSEIWVSFNPRLKTDPTYQDFVLNPPPDAKVVQIGWQDNPWLPEELRKEKDHLYAVDREAAEHVWGGRTKEFNKAEILLGKWQAKAFRIRSFWDGPYQGADWGFARDPSALVRCYIAEETIDGITYQDLYVSHEAYGVGVEITDLPAFFAERVPGAESYVTRADSARPETISHMQRHGWSRMEPSKKGKGSVEDGIMHLRGYRRIYIHPRCKETIQEAKLWSWKTDRKSGDILPVPVDKHNHVWDSVRYALEPVMRHEGDRGLLVI